MSDSLVQLDDRRKRFFSQVHSPPPLLTLIDHLPATYFFAKDVGGHFVHVNKAMLSVLGAADLRDVVGKTDYDFFSHDVASRYQEQDRQVMTSGLSLVDHVCVVPDVEGILRWYVETKIPLYDQNEQALGVAGVMYDVQKAGATLAPYQRLSQAVGHISDHYAEKISVGALARLVDLSVSQFNRTFKQLFRITPSQYIVRVRINAACSLLRSTSQSIEAIAGETGFCDASHFVRQFRKVMGVTPKAYREALIHPAKLRKPQQGSSSDAQLAHSVGITSH
jgi:AraC-like DNA-binding protein